MAPLKTDYNQLLLHHLSGRSIALDQAMHMLLDIKYDMALQLTDENERKPLRLTDVGD